MAGGTGEYQKLTKEERLELRAVARQLYEAGRSAGGAEKFESSHRNGFLYVIRHRRLEGVKVGRACDPQERLRGYQTACPRREYVLEYAKYFEDCYTAERLLHARLSEYQLKGEWFTISADQAQEAIEAYGRLPKHPEL